MTSKKVDNDDETVSIVFFKKDLAILLDTLIFAQRAASLLAQQEITKGSGLSGATKMQSISDNATALYRILYHHYDIGEPSSDTLN